MSGVGREGGGIGPLDEEADRARAGTEQLPEPAGVRDMDEAGAASNRDRRGEPVAAPEEPPGEEAAERHRRQRRP